MSRVALGLEIDSNRSWYMVCFRKNRGSAAAFGGIFLDGKYWIRWLNTSPLLVKKKLISSKVKKFFLEQWLAEERQENFCCLSCEVPCPSSWIWRLGASLKYAQKLRPSRFLVGLYCPVIRKVLLGICPVVKKSWVLHCLRIDLFWVFRKPFT